MGRAARRKRLRPRREPTSLGEIEQRLRNLQAIFDAHGLQVRRRSVLADALGASTVLPTNLRPLGRDGSPLLAAIAGTADLAQRLSLVSGHRDFHKLVPHLRLLNRTDPSQYGPRAAHDQNSNKLFELHIAVLAMQFASVVELENPVKSAGVYNPDLLFRWRKKSWGIACKVPQTSNPGSIVQLIKDGIRQLEGSACDRGIVAMNLRNVWPAKRFFREEPLAGGSEIAYTAFESVDAAVAAKDAALRELVEKMGERRAAAGLLKAFTVSRRLVPGVLCFPNIIAGVMDSQHGYQPALIAVPTAIDFAGFDGSDCISLARAFASADAARIMLNSSAQVPASR
jgi:hypothetical protein